MPPLPFCICETNHWAIRFNMTKNSQADADMYNKANWTNDLRPKKLECCVKLLDKIIKYSALAKHRIWYHGIHYKCHEKLLRWIITRNTQRQLNQVKIKKNTDEEREHYYWGRIRIAGK